MTDSPELKLTDAFRAARRWMLGVCGVGIAWSAAQFDIPAIEIPILKTVDLRAASIPLLLGCAVLFMTGRILLEFAMMPLRVRQWTPAQLDLYLALILARLSFVCTAAATHSRSLTTVDDLATRVGRVILELTILTLLNRLNSKKLATEYFHAQREKRYVIDALRRRIRILRDVRNRRTLRVAAMLMAVIFAFITAYRLELTNPKVTVATFIVLASQGLDSFLLPLIFGDFEAETELQTPAAP